MAVDIGLDATNRTGTRSGGYTIVNKSSSASIKGNITSIEIWAASNISNLVVGTFYATNGSTLKCRASEAIPGTVYGGSRKTIDVSIAVEIGDLIGAYWTSGTIENSTSGEGGIWYDSGSNLTPGDEEAYNSYSNFGISLGGYIEEVVAAGRSFGFIIG